MGVAVGDVVELVGPDRAVRLGPGQLLGETARQLHVIVRVAIGHGRNLDQRGAGKAQRVLLFLRLRLGNDDDRLEAEGAGDEGEADAGVAGRPLDDRAAGPKLALGDGVPDDEQGGAILDRLTRIHELGLAENLAARLLGGTAQADQRGIADGFDDGGKDGHDGFLDWWTRRLTGPETGFKASDPQSTVPRRPHSGRKNVPEVVPGMKLQSKSSTRMRPKASSARTRVWARSTMGSG